MSTLSAPEPGASRRRSIAPFRFAEPENNDPCSIRDVGRIGEMPVSVGLRLAVAQEIDGEPHATTQVSSLNGIERVGSRTADMGCAI